MWLRPLAVAAAAATWLQVGASASTFNPDAYSQVVLAYPLTDAVPTSYCLDIRGCCGVFGVNKGAPVLVHSCKVPNDGNPEWLLDQIWDMNFPMGGMVRWPSDPQFCLEAAEAADGAGIFLKPCDAKAHLQRFMWDEHARTVTLFSDLSLCWAVAAEWRKSSSGTTNHVRDLALRTCFGPGSPPAAHKQWLVPSGALGPHVAQPGESGGGSTDEGERNGTGGRAFPAALVSAAVPAQLAAPAAALVGCAALL